VPALAQLKTLFQKGYDRDLWSFDSVLGAARGKLLGEDMIMFETLAAAILDEIRIRDLDRFECCGRSAPAPLGGSRAH
jgi:hypothetical protein